MKNALAVYVREIRSYFLSPIFYIIAAVFMLVVGNYFKDNFFNFATRTMQMIQNAMNYGGQVQYINVNAYVVQPSFSFINYVFILIVPLLTMRLYAEEKKNGTMELLMTSPITTWQVMFGKFFSCWTVYTIIMAFTVVFNILMSVYSEGAIDWGIVWSAYLGTFLFGGTLIAIGMFFSSLTENQIIAAAVTITFVMALWLLVFTARFLSQPWNQIVSSISLSEHLDSFAAGYVGLKHIFYYGAMMFFWLFMTGVSVESARWRQ